MTNKIFVLSVLFACAIGIISSLKVSSPTARSYEKLSVLSLISVGSAMIIYPESTTYIANTLGIGRGTDLLLYMFIVATLYTSARIYLELKSLSLKISRLAIQIALISYRQNLLHDSKTFGDA